MVKMFADTADWEEMTDLASRKVVQGFTTNPTLMRKAKVKAYAPWGEAVAQMFADFPISFEVIADDLHDMKSQAKRIASWGDNVYVKIPITNTQGQSTVPLIAELSSFGIKVNVTAVFTQEQVSDIVLHSRPAIISVFAGRVHDAGADASRVINYGFNIRPVSGWTGELLWASTRQVYDYVLAGKCGADIITVTPDLLAKFQENFGKDLKEFSLETVKMFKRDADEAGYIL